MSAAKKTEILQLESPPSGERGTILAMIEKVLTIPDFPVEKLERMFDLHQKANADYARKTYYAALAEMQPNLPVIQKNGTLKTNVKDKQGNKTGEQKEQNRYALWEDIMEGILPILSQYGFSIFFQNEQPTPDRITTICTLAHKEGHKETSSIALPMDSSGSKNNVQGWGSSASYGKRYSSGALINFVARGEDDDGEAAGIEGMATLDEEQLTIIRGLLSDTKTSEEAFLHHITKTESLEAVPAGAFESLKGFLTAKKKKQKAEQEALV